MSSTPNATESSAASSTSNGWSRLSDWLPSRRALLLIAAAFVLGLGLFLVVWMNGRDHDFYTVEPIARPDAASEFEPLPVPLPAGERRGASGLDEPAQRSSEPTPRIVEQAPAPQPPEPVAAPTPPPPPASPLASGDSPEPIPTRMPAPDYPRHALRRGIEGTVMVRADVGPDGVPTSVSLVQGSGSRELDRAALSAVRRWRFRPAQVNGQPTVGSVVVPIEFRTGR